MNTGLTSYTSSKFFVEGKETMETASNDTSRNIHVTRDKKMFVRGVFICFFCFDNLIL